jgi:serine protease Do
MQVATNPLIAKTKKSGAALVLAALMAGVLVSAPIAQAASAQLEESSVAPLTALDKAMESVAARVTPAVVSVAVTAKADEEDSAQSGVPQGALPPGFEFFFGNPQGRKKAQDRVEHGVGSGVILTPDGYIVTNAHVVNNATKISVTLNDRRIFKAKLIGIDKLNDLAVIKIETKGLTAIEWGDSTKLHPGQTVMAFGSPFGYFQFSVTRGIVSALDRPNMDGSNHYKPGQFIQTDAAINPGNSGGPLVNAHGELIGINTFIISGSGNFAGAGFAIPSQIVRNIAEALMKDGVVHHGYLGITMADVTPDNAESFNLPDASGAVVSEVKQDSPAGRAGLKHDDVLRELDGKKISTSSALQVAISQTAPGTVISLGILREGKPQTIKVKVGELDAKTETASSEGETEGKPGKLGLTIAQLDDDVRQQLQIGDEVKGVVVANVRQGSPAEDAGLAQGDVILEINHHAVTTPEGFAKEMHASPEGKSILLRVWSHGGVGYRVVHPEGSEQ